MSTQTATPSAPTRHVERRSARERLLAAADELFYEEGIHTVGIDRIIERAGVAKASLYDTFGSKDELIRAYLEQRSQARKLRISNRMAQFEAPRDKLLSFFDLMADYFANPKFRGCAFVRASAEGRADSPVKGVCDDSRSWIRELFAGLARDAGAADAETLAIQLAMLYDGATVAAQMDRNPDVARLARGAATLLIDAAIAAGRQ